MPDEKSELYQDLADLANQYCLTSEELIAVVGEFVIWQELETELSFLCMDCSVHTGRIGHYYMVGDKVWEKAVPEGDGMLCFDCLAKRLGRDVTTEDLTTAPVNWKWLHGMDENFDLPDGPVCLSCERE